MRDVQGKDSPHVGGSPLDGPDWVLESISVFYTNIVEGRQSILKDAYAGKLVPQDPANELANDLLARITAEKPTV